MFGSVCFLDLLAASLAMMVMKTTEGLVVDGLLLVEDLTCKPPSSGL